MRKFLLFIIPALGLFFLVVYISNSTGESKYSEASIHLINQAETEWYNAGILNYRVNVEVEFSTERRLHMVTVKNGLVQQATLAYWDGNDWGNPQEMNLEQAFQYTIPGLFNSLRQEINLNIREDLRVDMHEDPIYPRYIYFGFVWTDGEQMENSEARITVSEFELIPANTP